MVCWSIGVGVEGSCGGGGVEGVVCGGGGLERMWCGWGEVEGGVESVLCGGGGVDSGAEGSQSCRHLRFLLQNTTFCSLA